MRTPASTLDTTTAVVVDIHDHEADVAHQPAVPVRTPDPPAKSASPHLAKATSHTLQPGRHPRLATGSSSQDYTPVFKKDSIFYPHAADSFTNNSSSSESSSSASLNSTPPDVSPVASPNSKNDIFGQDFSSFPSAASRRGSASGPALNTTTNAQPLERSRSTGASLASKTRSIFDEDFSSKAPQSVLFSGGSGPTSEPPVSLISRNTTATVVTSSLDKCKTNADIKFDSWQPASLLGEGRYASVYSGTCLVGTRPIPCAVKVMHAGDSDAQMNGITEAITLHTLHDWICASNCTTSTEQSLSGHPNIVHLMGIQNDTADNLISGQPQFLLALEQCRNGTLFDYISRHPSQCGRARWAKWCRQIAAAVAFCHTGGPFNNDPFDHAAVIHHDIKPHNILLDDQLNAKLADFGGSTLIAYNDKLEQVPLLRDGLGRGTQAYAAPEIVTPPDFSYSFATDIYSLGCTFYTLLTGREPFADVHNPAHQLWCIRRGFWESGANPLVSASSHLRGQPRPASASTQSKSLAHVSRSMPPHLDSTVIPHTPPLSAPIPSNSSSPFTLPLLAFPSGDSLLESNANDRQAATRIISLLKRCTATDMVQRPIAATVVQEMLEIEALLIRDDDNSNEELASPEKAKKSPWSLFNFGGVTT